MELDIIKLQTTWNDAAGSLNNNFAKIQQAINTGSGGGGGVVGGGIYEIKYDFLNGNPLSEEDIAFNAEVFDKLSRNEVSALYIVVDEGGEVRFVADSFYYMPPVDGEGVSALILNFTAETLSLMGLPQRVIQIGSDGSAEEIPLSGSGMSIVHLSIPDEIARFYSNNPEASFLSTLIVDDIDNAVNPLLGRIVDFSSEDITYSCSNGDVRRVYFNSDYTIKKRGLIEGVIYLGDNLTDFQKQANLAYSTAMKDLNNCDYSNGNKKRVGVVVYYNGDFYNALIFDKRGIVILAGLELQGWIIDEAGNTTLTESVNIGGADIDTSKFATTAQLQELDNILSDEIDGLKDSKQNTISDLDVIRSGAALGATALQEHQDISHLATKTEVEAKYTKPSSGIPKSDLVSEVQESLGKADTAIQNVKTINGESILGEGNLTIQGGNGSYDDTEIRNELSKKADVSGVYPEMTVGMTRDMLGVGEGDEGEFLFRPTDGDGSIKDGFASIERIEGNSVVWNQKSNNSWIVRDGTMVSENGVYTITPTGNYPGIVSSLTLSSGNKYLLLAHCAKEIRVNLQGIESIANKTGNFAWLFLEAGASVASTTLYTINVTETFTISNLVIADLTQMFGAGNEPSTVEEFYQRIPKGIDINAYNEGEVVNMNVEGIKSVGFNAWDEEWELGYIDASNGNTIYALNHICAKNKIHILPNTTYYFAKPAGVYTIIAYYDMDGLYIGQQNPFATSGIGGTFKTFENAHYMRFYCAISEYNNDICINLVHTGYRNGEYEPYVSDEIALPIADYFPNGMNSIGDVKDELTATEAIQRIGVVDMGTLEWKNLDTSNSMFYLSAEEVAYLNMATTDNTNAPTNLVSSLHISAPTYDISNLDKVFRGPYKTIFSGCLTIKDLAYTDATSFKAAMSGVMLYYELAEPIVTTFDKPLDLDYQVWDFGTEEAIAEGKTTPLKASIIYEFNARDTIRANKLALKNKADKTYVDEAIAQAITLTLNTEV